MSTYKRETSDVSADVRVIPLSDNMTVGENNVITFTGEGEFSYALEYTYQINTSNAYTLYTQPVTVKVASPNQTDTDADTEETVTGTEDITTNKPEETTGENENGKFPVIPVVLGVVAGVIGVALIVFFVVKKKKA